MVYSRHGRRQNVPNTKNLANLANLCNWFALAARQHVAECETSAFKKKPRMEGEQSRCTWVTPHDLADSPSQQRAERGRERALTIELATAKLNIPTCWASQFFELPNMAWTACVWESWQVLDAARQMSLPFSLRGNVWEICHQLLMPISVDIQFRYCPTAGTTDDTIHEKAQIKV